MGERARASTKGARPAVRPTNSIFYLAFTPTTENHVIFPPAPLQFIFCINRHDRRTSRAGSACAARGEGSFRRVVRHQATRRRRINDVPQLHPDQDLAPTTNYDVIAEQLAVDIGGSWRDEIRWRTALASRTHCPPSRSVSARERGLSATRALPPFLKAPVAPRNLRRKTNPSRWAGVDSAVTPKGN